MSSSGEVLPIESGAYSTGKMVGFGNPAFAPSKPGLFSKVGSFLSSDSSKSKATPTPTFRPFEQPGPYGGPTTSAYPPEDQTTGEMAFGGRTGPRKRGTPGGLWSSESPTGGLSGRGGSGSGSGGYTESKHGVSTTTHAPLGDYELRLIDAITTPSGVRVVPTSKELSDFRKQCETFDAYEISAALDKKLLSDLLPTKLKALYVIESLMKREGSAGEIVEDYFNDNSQNLLQLENGQIPGNKAIQEKATQLLVLCGAKSPPVTSTIPVTTPTPIPTPSLSTPTPTQVVTTVSTESLIPDFSGMQVTTTSSVVSTPTPAPVPTTVKPFNLFDEDSSTESSSAGGIFGDLDIRTPAPTTTPSPQPVKPVQPSLPPSTSTPVDDPFGILSQPPPVQPKKVDRVSQLLNSPSTIPPSTPYQPSPYQSQQQPPFYQSPSYQQQSPLYNGYPPYQPSYPYGPTGYQPQPQQPYYPHQNPMYGGGFPPQSGSSGGMWGDLGGFGGASTAQPTRSTFPTTSTSNGKSSTSTSNFDFIDSSSTGGGSKPSDSFNFLDTMLKS
jgi:hypothetical protein